MVFLMQPAAGTDSPGVIVFTHKERPLLVHADAGLRRAMDRLRERYVTLMHWGAHAVNVGSTPHIDAHLASPGTMEFAPGVTDKRIDLCSRDFLPNVFRPLPDAEPTWDVLTVARPIPLKYMTDMLRVTRRALDTGVPVKVRFHVPVPPRMAGPAWDHEFFRYHEANFTDAEKRDHARVDTYPLGEDLFPVGPDGMVRAYNDAKSFALFTKREGNTRVVHEALLCGRPVIVRKDLQGGGRDVLDATNSLQFTDLDEAVDMFCKVHEGHAPKPDVDALRDRLTADANVPRIKAAIAELAEARGFRFDDRLDTTDLSRQLSSHHKTLPRSKCFPETDDLRSVHALYWYLDRQLRSEGRPVGTGAWARHQVARPLDATRRAATRINERVYQTARALGVVANGR